MEIGAQQTLELEDHFSYLMKMERWLEEQPESSFNPDLTKLDALIAAIDVR
jgi:TorA maturation chaperone TorD